MIGNAPVMQAVYALTRRAAQSSATVLLTGENMRAEVELAWPSPKACPSSWAATRRNSAMVVNGPL